mmetsp:Transcript_7338/g.19053  ORF Transcript_7338/g.19053 Transcript_7338/m.19053 type:complete len:373 (-) Transcript_7338:294-1412(-)
MKAGWRAVLHDDWEEALWQYSLAATLGSADGLSNVAYIYKQIQKGEGSDKKQGESVSEMVESMTHDDEAIDFGSENGNQHGGERESDSTEDKEGEELLAGSGGLFGWMDTAMVGGEGDHAGMQNEGDSPAFARFREKLEELEFHGDPKSRGVERIEGGGVRAPVKDLDGVVLHLHLLLARYNFDTEGVVKVARSLLEDEDRQHTMDVRSTVGFEECGQVGDDDTSSYHCKGSSAQALLPPAVGNLTTALSLLSRAAFERKEALFDLATVYLWGPLSNGTYPGLPFGVLEKGTNILSEEEVWSLLWEEVDDDSALDKVDQSMQHTLLTLFLYALKLVRAVFPRSVFIAGVHFVRAVGAHVGNALAALVDYLFV